MLHNPGVESSLETHPERLTVVITTKGDSNMYWLRVEYFSNQDILVFTFSIHVLQMFKFPFHFDITMYVVVDLWQQMTVQSIWIPLCNNEMWKKSRGVNTFWRHCTCFLLIPLLHDWYWYIHPAPSFTLPQWEYISIKCEKTEKKSSTDYILHPIYNNILFESEQVAGRDVLNEATTNIWERLETQDRSASVVYNSSTRCSLIMG
jgi:hypothetical protein